MYRSYDGVDRVHDVHVESPLLVECGKSQALGIAEAVPRRVLRSRSRATGGCSASRGERGDDQENYWRLIA